MTGWWFDCAYTMTGIWKMTMLMNTKLMWNMINHITLNIQKKWKYLNYFQWKSKEVILLFIRSHNKIEFIKYKSFIYYCIKKMQPEWLNISLQIWLMIIVCIGAVSNDHYQDSSLVLYIGMHILKWFIYLNINNSCVLI